VTETRLYPRFPSVSLISQAEFSEYCRTAQAGLDARFLHETSLTTHEDQVTQPGTCAPCARRAVFTTTTARWDRRPDGLRLPDWSDAQECDCEDHLTGRLRALAHFAQTEGHLRPWTRLLLFGRASKADRRLAALAGAATRIARLDPGDPPTLPAADAAFHLAVSVDTLHHVPPLRPALAELRRVLAPGGGLIALAPFRYRAARTTSRDDFPRVGGRMPVEVREAVHEIGWDVLDWLREAGFRHAAAHAYWSNELGYLGSFNMLLRASL